MTTERLSATVVGRVQGVGFRWWAREAAGRLGLAGWVMNADGAAVEAVDFRRSPAGGRFDGFGIVRA